MPSGARYLHWDCETRSTVDLRATGAYVYAAHPSTEVTVARLALDREAPVEWRPGQDLLPRFYFALADPRVEVVAHNAAFERLMLEHILHPRHGWPLVSIDRWICTMARCRAMALPSALDNAAIAAGLDIKKDNAGRQLMLRMCRPRGFNPDGSPVWWTDPERMDRLSDYCATDVKVERALMLATVPLPIEELDVWDLTETMNDRGVRFDLDFVRAARAVALTTSGTLDRQIAEITDGVVMKVSEIGALKTWLHRRGVDLSPPPELVRGPVGVVLDTLTEASAEASEVAALERAIGVEDEVEAEEALPELRRRDIIRLLADPRVGAVEKRALRCRFEGGKISVKKLDAIVNRADDQGVVRGLLSYHGASTGRYISQGLQVQNFPRDVVHDWDGHRTLLDHGAAMVDAIGGPPLDVISRMLRGAIIPRDGHEIATCDFSSVEAIGVAGLAGQSDLVDAFRAKRKMYEEMAGAVYNRRASDIAKDSKERQVGKALVLGAGYGLGWWKFRETCLVQAGVLLSPEEAARAIDTYRQTFPEIPKLWRQLNRAAIKAVKNPGLVVDAAGGRIRFRRDPLWLRMKLPSGRYLWYARPLVEKGRFDTDTVTYMSVNAKTRRWERTQTYGGRLCENAVQALCRDLLVRAAMGLEQAGYQPITLIHDEVVAEPPIGHGSVGEMCEIMCALPDWALGFPLSASGARGPRYIKT
jgi:DNA polymerase